MSEEDKVISTPTVSGVDPTLADLRSKIAEMTMYMTSKAYARLSQKSKFKKILDYNMLVQVEHKLSSSLGY